MKTQATSKHHRNTAVLTVLSLMYSMANAQQVSNLLVNPSFENKIYCPTGYYNSGSNIFDQNVLGWIKTTNTTPDYFNSCNNAINGSVGVPINNSGTMPSHSGEAYAGIVTYWNDDANKPSNKRWREYLQTEIQLESGIEYDIQFHITLASNSGWKTKNLGANISTGHILQADQLPVLLTPNYQHPDYITSIGQWLPISFKYTAQTTGTHFLTIGDFSENNFPLETENSSLDGYAYYFVDDVSVSAQGCCPDDLHIQNHTYSSAQTVAANHTLTVGPDVTVQQGANVTFIAGDEIVFLPGFSGTDFHAYIDACPPQFQQKSIDQFPNVITPNGDGFNDEICLTPSGGSNYSIQIFNRWGELVYAASGAITEIPLCIWNGTCNQPFPACSGNPLSDGTYFGVFNIIGCDFPDGNFTQDITLLGAAYKMDGSDTTDTENQIGANAPSSVIERKAQDENGEALTEGFRVAPNPTTGGVTIRLPSDRKYPWNIQIHDASGNLVFVFENTNLSLLNIDISKLSSGLYHLRARNQGEVFTDRIVLQ